MSNARAGAMAAENHRPTLQAQLTTMPPIFHMIAGAPDPVAPFSHAVEADGWVLVTGQMPFVDTSLDAPYPEGIEAQTRQVLKNLHTVLAGCGLGLEHALSVRVYLTHFEEDYVAMNAVYAEHFVSGRRPARTCVGVTGLAKGARIEIDLVARRSDSPSSANLPT
jgi:2-iminobutanoate/2-iminopropanoate deaminase